MTARELSIDNMVEEDGGLVNPFWDLPSRSFPLDILSHVIIPSLFYPWLSISFIIIVVSQCTVIHLAFVKKKSMEWDRELKWDRELEWNREFISHHISQSHLTPPRSRI